MIKNESLDLPFDEGSTEAAAAQRQHKSEVARAKRAETKKIIDNRTQSQYAKARQERKSK